MPEFRRTESLAADVLDSMPVRIAVIDSHGNITAVNKAWADFARENGDPDLSHTCVGVNYLDVCRRARGKTSEGAKEAMLGLQAVLSKQLPRFHMSYHFPTPSGDYWYSLSASPLIGQAGDGCVVLHTDVTESIEAQHALEEREALYRSLIETMSEGFATSDAQYRFTYVNARFAEMLHYSPEEMIGRELESFMDTSERAGMQQQESERRAGRHASYIARWRAKDGGEVYTLVSPRPMFNDDGSFAGSFAVLTDITELKRAEDLDAALNSINSAIGSTLEIDEIIRLAVTEAAEAMGVESAAVSMRLDGRWELRFVYKLPEEAAGWIYPDEEAPDALFAIKTGRPVVLNDTGDYTVPEVAKKYHVRSALLAPIIVKDEIMGIITFHYHRQPTTFSDLQVGFAGKLATSVSLALHNAKLYASEKEAVTREAQARSHVENQFIALQRVLIPEQPAICPGYQIGAAYVPASPGQEIGGDFYDVFLTEGGRTTVLIGDVSGKDIRAAAFSAAVRNTMRAFAYELGSPGLAIDHTNAVISAQQLYPDMFATTLIVVLDTRSGQFLYANAGHPPAAVYRTEGTVEFCPYGQQPIGIGQSLTFDEQDGHLGPGDKIILYTDGITEARRGKKMFEMAGIESILKRCGHRSPDDIVAELLAAAKDWASGHLTDDVAILVVGRDRD